MIKKQYYRLEKNLQADLLVLSGDSRQRGRFRVWVLIFRFRPALRLRESMN